MPEAVAIDQEKIFQIAVKGAEAEPTSRNNISSQALLLF